MSLIPHKRKKLRDQTEDAELLKLVGAVLEGARKQQKPRGLRGLLGWKLEIRKLARKHPVAAVCVPLVVLCIVFLVGVATGSARQRGTEWEPDGVDSPGGGSSGGRRTPGVSPSGGGGTARTPGSAAPVGNAGAVGPAEEREDIAKALIARVVDGDYGARSDIATGRFLQDFENQWFLLVDVDREKLQTARRGQDWLQVRGPYAVSEARQKGELTRTLQRWKTASEALIRVVLEEEDWKLEFIRVY